MLSVAQWLMKNCDIKYVQTQMGHARAALTLETYSHQWMMLAPPQPVPSLVNY
jgi:integrase